MLGATSALLLVGTVVFVSIGLWLAAAAAGMAAIVVGINAWSARARWRRRQNQ